MLIIKKIYSDFILLDDWEQRYQYLIELGKNVNLNIKDKNSKNIISECINNTWLVINKKNNRYYFKGDSDSLIMKGLIKIIIEIFSGKLKEEIMKIDIYAIFDKLQLQEHLSNNRNNGVMNIIKKIKAVK